MSRSHLCTRLAAALWLLLFAACGSDDDAPSTDAAAGDPDAPVAAGLAGAYARVIPGYDTEAECRDENPDKLFACSERVSLCVGGAAYVQFTDIVFDGDWTEAGDQATVVFTTWEGSFSEDGTTVLVRQEDGSLLSEEI